MKYLITVSTIALLTLFILGMPGCKDDDEGSDCHGDLTLNPDYAADTCHYKFDGNEQTAPFDISFNSASSPMYTDTNALFIDARWKGINNTEISISLSEADLSSSFYEMLRTRENGYISDGHDFGNHAAIAVKFGGKTYVSKIGDNANSYFKITYRSAQVNDNGHLAAIVQGVFCCTVYSFPDALKTPKTVQGNFNGKFKVD